MRSLSVIIAAMLVSGTISAQAWDCGMFGMLVDDYGRQYVGRFDQGLDNVELESMISCDFMTVPIVVFDMKRGKRWTKMYITIEHPDFDDSGYTIKYPTGSYLILRQKSGATHSDNPFWPITND